MSVKGILALWTVVATIVVGALVFIATRPIEDRCLSKATVYTQLADSTSTEDPPKEENGVDHQECTYESQGVTIDVDIFTHADAGGALAQAETDRLDGPPAFTDMERSTMETWDGGFAYIRYLVDPQTMERTAQVAERALVDDNRLCVVVYSYPQEGPIDPPSLDDLRDETEQLAEEACLNAS